MEVCEVQNEPCVPCINMANVFDIDADDEDNPQLVSEYVNDIYAYLRELEVRLRLFTQTLWQLEPIFPKEIGIH